jgi:hypothetical protein
MARGRVTLRILFADSGEFHAEEVSVPKAAVERHDRLLDCLMEDPDVLKTLHVDLGRVVSVQRIDSD